MLNPGILLVISNSPPVQGQAATWHSSRGMGLGVFQKSAYWVVGNWQYLMQPPARGAAALCGSRAQSSPAPYLLHLPGSLGSQALPMAYSNFTLISKPIPRGEGLWTAEGRLGGSVASFPIRCAWRAEEAKRRRSLALSRTASAASPGLGHQSPVLTLAHPAGHPPALPSIPALRCACFVRSAPARVQADDHPARQEPAPGLRLPANRAGKALAGSLAFCLMPTCRSPLPFAEQASWQWCQQPWWSIAERAPSPTLVVMPAEVRACACAQSRSWSI